MSAEAKGFVPKDEEFFNSLPKPKRRLYEEPVYLEADEALKELSNQVQKFVHDKSPVKKVFLRGKPLSGELYCQLS